MSTFLGGYLRDFRVMRAMSTYGVIVDLRMGWEWLSEIGPGSFRVHTILY